MNHKVGIWIDHKKAVSREPIPPLYLVDRTLAQARNARNLRWMS